MKIKVRHLFTIIFVTILIFSACKVEGPTGPEGPQGSQGSQGIQGEQGPKGDPGTANVIYSDWLDIVWNSTDTALLKTMRIDESHITQDFIENGIVLMFIKLEVPGTVVTVQLPYVQGNDFLYFRTGIQDSPEFAGLVLYLDSIDDSTPVSEGFTDLQIKYFLIPGGVFINDVTGKRTADWQEVDLSDYDQVVEALGLKD